eukprot:TRINITY_DN87273_c0_g1_i1.p1 TRINITY_DN87273_c0_g1~~TRINITY_DN87273_c0_g1_i1.p1  ORF type:complete len:226 (-),score=27.83 TRINITY_DN87273_c0_g1_i1:34-651(-)
MSRLDATAFPGRPMPPVREVAGLAALTAAFPTCPTFPVLPHVFTQMRRSMWVVNPVPTGDPLTVTVIDQRRTKIGQLNRTTEGDLVFATHVGKTQPAFVVGRGTDEFAHLLKVFRLVMLRDASVPIQKLYCTVASSGAGGDAAVHEFNSPQGVRLAVVSQTGPRWFELTVHPDYQYDETETPFLLLAAIAALWLKSGELSGERVC